MKIHYIPSRHAVSFTVIMRILFFAVVLTGCATEKSAKRYADNHRDKAAEYCAVTFPVKEVTDTFIQIDSSRAVEFRERLERYADSVLEATKTRTADTSLIRYIDRVKEVVKTEIRYKMKPCNDSVRTVVRTVESTAKTEYLTAQIKAKDETITKRDNRITKLEEKVAAQKKYVWLFWIILVIGTLYMTRGIWGRLISPLNFIKWP